MVLQKLFVGNFRKKLCPSSFDTIGVVRAEIRTNRPGGSSGTTMAIQVRIAIMTALFGP